MQDLENRNENANKKLVSSLAWFKQLFSESGDVSMTRFLSFVCVVTATVIALVSLVTKADVVSLVTVFLTLGLGAKVSQRFVESREASTIEPSNPETSDRGRT